MITGLNFVMLHVPNVAEAAAFYTEKLGFEVEDRAPDFVQFKQPAGNGAAFALGKGEVVNTEGGAELWWFVDNADATFSAWRDEGVEMVSEPKDEPFGRAFSIKAPGGYTLYMLQLPQRT